MSIEAGVVVDQAGQPLHWHVPPSRSGGALPDSVDLWQVFWENRERLAGFAHSHPGSGMPAPSWTDVTTFAALEGALGKRLDWWICSSDRLVLVRWEGPEKYDYRAQGGAGQSNAGEQPAWLQRLRELSNYNQQAH